MTMLKATQKDGTDQAFTYVTLEVANIRLTTASSQSGTRPAARPPTVEVQLRGDKDNRWWPAPRNDQEFKTYLDALDKKRVIHARLGLENGQLIAINLLILFVDPLR